MYKSPNILTLRLLTIDWASIIESWRPCSERRGTKEDTKVDLSACAAYIENRNEHKISLLIINVENYTKANQSIHPIEKQHSNWQTWILNVIAAKQRATYRSKEC